MSLYTYLRSTKRIAKMIQDKDELLKLIREDAMNLRLAHDDFLEEKEIVLEAVKKNPNAMQFASHSLQKDEELLSYVTKDDKYYYDMIDPRSGLSYDIPMLSTLDPAYFWKYVDYMKQKEQSPDTFDRMLRWD